MRSAIVSFALLVALALATDMPAAAFLLLLPAALAVGGMAHCLIRMASLLAPHPDDRDG